MEGFDLGIHQKFSDFIGIFDGFSKNEVIWRMGIPQNIIMIIMH